MSHFSTVLYPNPEDLSFDMSYYLSTHFPLVEKHWSKYGLKEWKVVRLDEKLLDGSKAPYSVQATIVWENAEGLEKALAAEETKEVFADIPKFTNTSPIFLKGGIVGSS